MSAVVWAKMKGFPTWPARIIDPKAHDLNQTIRKEAMRAPSNSHFVRFYGTHDYSWVQVKGWGKWALWLMDSGVGRPLFGMVFCLT